ncbi:MAG: UDP-N-acetylmuramate--L-alanine ligase, partial [Bacilli bacterium]|nr:UDP-N-acetylmuramate--L-alanine ligase [Bacilli bacterium]
MYYLIGIKGSGMSALACILSDLGYTVKGSDVDKHFFTEEGLKERNIELLTYNENNIKEGMTIISGNAIKDDNPEYVKAKQLDLKIYTYQEMVARLTNMFRTITIAGCHGKTSTTALLSHILYNIGGAKYLIGDGTCHADKENKYFVLEACEYKRHFLEYNPYYAIITNIELDHVDYFQNIDDVIDAFRQYANNAEKMVIACGDDPYTHSLEINKPIFYYGIDEDNDIIAKDVNYTEKGTSFDVFVEDNYYGHFDLPIFGKHQLLNALAAISVCYYERLEAKEVANQIKTFKGAKRRFTETVVGNSIVIDDYAHHPSEVRVTIKAAKQKYPNKEIVAIFQPHTYSRAKEFAEDYIEALKNTDKAYIMDIHGSREKAEDFDITSADFIKQIPNAEHIAIDEGKKLAKHKQAVLICMSPNDISTVEHD